jgi:hypothetical protein
MNPQPRLNCIYSHQPNVATLTNYCQVFNNLQVASEYSCEF